MTNFQLKICNPSTDFSFHILNNKVSVKQSSVKDLENSPLFLHPSYSISSKLCFSIIKIKINIR